MNCDEMKAVYAAIEGLGWLEAKKVAVACHVLSARLGRLGELNLKATLGAGSNKALNQLSEEFNAFAVRAELVLDAAYPSTNQGDQHDG